MLKQFYIFCFLIGMTHLSQAQHLQLIENRGEIGVFAGQASYRGDIAPDILKFNNNFGAFYKKKFNDYAGFRLNYEQIQLGADDLTSKNGYATSRDFNFLRQFHEISLMGEFNFTRFLPGNKSYRFTPYLGIGVGYLIESSVGKSRVLSIPTEKKGYSNFPIQLGIKFNLIQRLNFFAETQYRFVNSDELDFIADGQLVLNYQGSQSWKDQFFSVKGGVSYNLIKIYGEEKWKPGKKSKSSSRKEKESSEKKSGFFSRLKFKGK